jgi:hypothetical protein
MPARPYTQLLGSYTGPPTSERIAVFVAAPGHVTIIRDITFVGAGTAPQFFVLTWLIPGGSYKTLIRRMVPGNEEFHVKLRQVIPPTAVVEFQGGHDLELSLCVTGYVLTDE